MIKLSKITSSAIREQNHATNANDKSKKTCFALQGDTADGYWRSNLPKKSVVWKIEIRPALGYEDELRGAKIFIGEGEKPFEKFPDNLDKFPQIKMKYYNKAKNVYAFEGRITGDFIKIISGRADGKLAFSYI